MYLILLKNKKQKKKHIKCYTEQATFFNFFSPSFYLTHSEPHFAHIKSRTRHGKSPKRWERRFRRRCLLRFDGLEEESSP